MIPQEFSFTVEEGTGMIFYAFLKKDGRYLITFENKGKCFYPQEDVFRFILKGKWKTDLVLIRKEKYESLIEDSDKLAKLEAYGVDNWSGYGEAMSDSEGYFEEEE